MEFIVTSVKFGFPRYLLELITYWYLLVLITWSLIGVKHFFWIKCKFRFRYVSEIRWYFLLLHLNFKSKRYIIWKRLRCTGLIPLEFPMRSKAEFFYRYSRVCQSRKKICEKDLKFPFQIWTWFSAKVVWSNLLASTYLRPLLLSTKHIIRNPWTDLETTFHPGTLEDKNGWVWSFQIPYKQQKTWSLEVLS